jgi:hypothetical protein
MVIPGGSAGQESVVWPATAANRITTPAPVKASLDIIASSCDLMDLRQENQYRDNTQHPRKRQ